MIQMLAKLSIPISGVLTLCAAYIIAMWITKNDTGTDRMREIASYIREGAMAFLMREYRIIAIFMAAMFLLLWPAINIQTALAFLLGATFSVLAGYFGMRSATNANVRTAAAARNGLTWRLRSPFAEVRWWAFVSWGWASWGWAY